MWYLRKFFPLLALLFCSHPFFTLAKLYTSVTQLPNTAFDFIIIGGGTAGNVVANRLTENTEFSVLVIEAGGSNIGVLDSEVPFLAASLAPNTPYDWNFTTTPQAGFNNRSIPYYRGHVLGGTSSINYMVYSRGSQEDWDGYAQMTGDEGWAWRNVQQYFRKNEKWSTPADNHSTIGKYSPSIHSTSGINAVSLAGFPQPIDSPFVNTAAQLPGEFGFNIDTNSGTPLGLGWLQSTIDSLGQRSSSATSYLGPAFINRTNLHVVTNTQVTRLIQTASSPPTFKSVEFSGPGGLHILSAKKEIILSAGAIGTPHILLNSGIGDSVSLSKIGVKPLVQLPDVGQHLFDQPACGVFWSVNSTDTLDTLSRNETLIADDLNLWVQNRSGRFVDSPLGNLVAWTRVPSNSSVFKHGHDPAPGPLSPHFEILPVNGIGGATEPPTGNYLTLVVALVSPVSRGSITLASSEPLKAPVIDPGLLHDEFDMAMMREGVRSAQRLASAQVWEDYIVAPFPGLLETNTEIDTYLGLNTITLYHPLGSAAMAAFNSTHGVVQPNLLLRGVAGVRVVDGSVIPRPPSANPQAVIYVIAERGADMIKADWC